MISYFTAKMTSVSDDYFTSQGLFANTSFHDLVRTYLNETEIKEDLSKSSNFQDAVSTSMLNATRGMMENCFNVTLFEQYIKGIDIFN